MVQSKVLSHTRGAELLTALGFQPDGPDELVTQIAATTLQPVHAAIKSAIDASRPARVCSAHGWVVHGLAIELGDGSRCGAFLENDGSRMALADDAGLLRRGGVWHAAEPGERLVTVRGRHSTMGYLCGEIELVLSSGRVLKILGENAAVFGDRFEYHVPPLDELADISFADGRCLGLVLRSQVVDDRGAATLTAGMRSLATSCADAGGAATTAIQPCRPPLAPPRVLHSIAELQRWTPQSATEPAALARAPSAPSSALPSRPRALHCHDCRGGYNETADLDYLACFRGWDAIDVFCYFGHHRISMPPAVWVSACHARGRPCLGTLIVEGAATASETSLLLREMDSSVEQLCRLCEHFAFDGYLINLESPLAGGRAQMGALHEFLATLTICLKQRIGEQALIIYYDSLDADGRVSYQNGLTPSNKPCFDACDGIFTNYWWAPPHLAQSAALAGPTRQCDVFVGVDCFARNTPYTHGTGCAAACAAARAAGLSLALFAPGWSIECGGAQCAREDVDAAADADRRFWEALGVAQLYSKR